MMDYKAQLTKWSSDTNDHVVIYIDDFTEYHQYLQPLKSTTNNAKKSLLGRFPPKFLDDLNNKSVRAVFDVCNRYEHLGFLTGNRYDICHSLFRLILKNIKNVYHFDTHDSGLLNGMSDDELCSAKNNVSNL